MFVACQKKIMIWKRHICRYFAVIVIVTFVVLLLLFLLLLLLLMLLLSLLLLYCYSFCHGYCYCFCWCYCYCCCCCCCCCYCCLLLLLLLLMLLLSLHLQNLMEYWYLLLSSYGCLRREDLTPFYNQHLPSHDVPQTVVVFSHFNDYLVLRKIV